MARGLIVCLLMSLAWSGLHVIAMHIRPTEKRFHAMFLAWALSLPFIALAYFFLPLPAAVASVGAGEQPGMGLFHAYLFHLLLFFLFVECFYHVERSVTLRFLIEILRQPQGRARLEDIRNMYHVGDMVERRLEALQDHHFITKRGEHWQLLPKGRFYARAMQFSAWVFQSKGQSERL